LPVLLADAIPLSQSQEGLSELFAEPTVLIAATLLIAVSIGWIVVARLINSYIRDAAYQARRRAAAQKRRGKPIPPPPDKHIWNYPP
jgi:hypothetical protein